MYLLIFKNIYIYIYIYIWEEGYSLPTLSQRMPPSLLLVMATHVHCFETRNGPYGSTGLTKNHSLKRFY